MFKLNISKSDNSNSDKSVKLNKLISVFYSWNNQPVLPIPTIKYDDIVDDSDFKPSAERIRDNEFRSNGVAVDASNLLYDYEEGKPIKEKVSDIQLALRTGKLDKADVQKLNELLTKKMDKNVQDKKDSDLLKSEEQASKNRSKALDKLLDVNSDTDNKI